MLTDSYRIWERKFADLLQVFYGVKESRLTDCLRILTIWERKFTDLLRIFYGVKESRLTDCVRILTGFGRGRLRITVGFLAAEREEAYGLFMDFCSIWKRRITDFERIWGGSFYCLTGFLPPSYGSGMDCLRILTGFGRGSLRIFYGF